MHDYILDSTQDKVASEGGKLGKLDVAIKLWEAEVETAEVFLIERGTPPAAAHIDAITIVSNRRKDKYADKNGS